MSAKPTLRPINPMFSSGPCSKRPGWSTDALESALLGRSHRSAPGKAKLAEVIDQLEENIRTLEGVSSCLKRGGIPALVKAVLQGFDREIVERQPLEYRCRCNRQSLLSQILPLARKEPEALIGDDGFCEAVCAYCGSRYVYTATELAAPVEGPPLSTV